MGHCPHSSHGDSPAEYCADHKTPGRANLEHARTPSELLRFCPFRGICRLTIGSISLSIAVRQLRSNLPIVPHVRAVGQLQGLRRADHMPVARDRDWSVRIHIQNLAFVVALLELKRWRLAHNRRGDGEHLRWLVQACAQENDERHFRNLSPAALVLSASGEASASAHALTAA